MNAKALCTPSTTATPGSAAGGTGCLCGNDLVAVGAAEFCGIKANGNGLAMPKATCASAGDKNNGKEVVGGTGCNCGTEALVPVSATEYCYAVNGQTGLKQTVKQCSKNNANQADGTNIAATACNCGTASATTCDFCLETANAVNKAAWAACPVTTGTAAFTKGPDKCKCGTGAVGYGEYCLASINGKLSACANNDGTVLNGATQCACINSGTGVATVTAATTGLCNAGVSSTKAACTSTDGSTANTAPCTCGTSTCTTGQKCTASTNTCAAAAPTAAPTFALSTITQDVTFSGLTAAQWNGGLKTAGEIGYAKVQGWTTGTGANLAIATGYTVTSAAARRATTVTFTSTLRASATAVTTATTAVTAANLNTEMTAVNTAKSLGATIPAASTMTVAAASSTTASSGTVSGASTVTTSIMAMAVAVLAAFQARQ